MCMVIIRETEHINISGGSMSGLIIENVWLAYVVPNFLKMIVERKKKNTCV